MDPNITQLHLLPPEADLVIGTIYIVWAVIIILLHLFCAYLIYSDQEMNNATYAFMINLSIADSVELAMLGVYAGVTILVKSQNAILARIASFICLGTWYTTCVLFALIAFSRWIAITRPHLEQSVLRYG